MVYYPPWAENRYSRRLPHLRLRFARAPRRTCAISRAGTAPALSRRQAYPSATSSTFRFQAVSRSLLRWYLLRPPELRDNPSLRRTLSRVPPPSSSRSPAAGCASPSTTFPTPAPLASASRTATPRSPCAIHPQPPPIPAPPAAKACLYPNPRQLPAPQLKKPRRPNCVWPMPVPSPSPRRRASSISSSPSTRERRRSAWSLNSTALTISPTTPSTR